MELDTTLLFQVLTWIVCGPGAGVAAYFLMEKVPALRRLASEAKRYVSLALSAAIAMVAFRFTIWMGYYPLPAAPRQWIEQLFAVSFVATGGSQIIHGRVKLRSA